MDNNNNIEEAIAEKIATRQNISDKDIDHLIITEINLAGYLKEYWQINYAKDRIKKIIAEKQLEKLPKEERVNFGNPGLYLIACILIGSLMTQHSKNIIIFIVGSLISISGIYFFILWVAKLIYKKRNGQKGFLLVKKSLF